MTEGKTPAAALSIEDVVGTTQVRSTIIAKIREDVDIVQITQKLDSEPFRTDRITIRIRIATAERIGAENTIEKMIIIVSLGPT